jgi:hypothetical protein
MTELHEELPVDLNVSTQSFANTTNVVLYSLRVEADEIWSFVDNKNN